MTGDAVSALASEYEGKRLRDAAGAALGAVTRVLYHPSEPQAIGFMIRPRAVLYVLPRPQRYLGLDTVRMTDAGPTADLTKLPSRRKGAELLGYEPDLTVIWTGMPVWGRRRSASEP